MEFCKWHAAATHKEIADDSFHMPKVHPGHISEGKAVAGSMFTISVWTKLTNVGWPELELNLKRLMINSLLKICSDTCLPAARIEEKLIGKQTIGSQN